MENREFYIPHDGIRLHAKLDIPELVEETCPVVILLHGFTGHMEERHILAMHDCVLELGMACLRVELYGHGKSGGTFRDHTLLRWIQEASAVVDYAADLPFAGELYLMGHSAGGLTTLLTGALQRDKLSALILLAPATVIKYGAQQGLMLNASFDPEHIPEEVVFPDGKVLGGDYFRTAQFLPIDEAAAAYRGPVLIVQADEDEAVPLELAYELEHKYRNATLKVIRGDNHCYDAKLPEAVEAVRDFLLRFAAPQIQEMKPEE